MKKQLVVSIALLTLQIAAGQPPSAAKNKLREMLKFYYLPFSVEFREGTTFNEIIPVKSDSSGTFNRLINTEDMQALDQEWNRLKESWAKRSLLSPSNIPVNQSQRVTSHLIGHHIPATRTAFDVMSIEERVKVQELLKNRPKEVQKGVLQLQLLKSFIKGEEINRLNFFIVSPHWCDSSREYRILLEAYAKEFPDKNLNLHSIIVEDPKEEIFDSSFFQDLFPHPKKYSHESVPRFIAMEVVAGVAKIYEEGEALEVLYDRFFSKHRGFLDKKTSFLKNVAAVVDSTKNLTAKQD